MMSDLVMRIRDFTHDHPMSANWRMVDSVDAVLDIHREHPDLGECMECIAPSGDPIVWPCATVQAIAEKLGVPL